MIPLGKAIKSCPGIGCGHTDSHARIPRTDFTTFTSTEGCQIFCSTPSRISSKTVVAGAAQRRPCQPNPHRIRGAVIRHRGNNGGQRRSLRHQRLARTAGAWYSAGDREGDFMALDADAGKPLWKFQPSAR